VEILNAGFLFGDDRPHVDEPPPRLGEHSESVLESLGFSAAERREILA
jgi:crotonobetainyl-CoA:carnitine CoA-transferase CaiB-like acyl-CoA transferase